MRTYTRKRPDHKFIDNVHSLCRLCLSNYEQCVPIFTEESETGSVNLPLRIMICIGLEIVKEDRLPSMLCVQCLTELNRLYAFRKKCEVAYQKLKSHVSAAKEKEYEALRREVVLEINREELIELLNADSVTQKECFSEKEVEQPQAEENRNTNHMPIEQKKEETAPPSETNCIVPLIPEEVKEVKKVLPKGPDISSFLTAMLIEMGILSQQEDCVTVTNKRMKTLNLESGDGELVTFQLVEEDEEDEATTPITYQPTSSEVTESSRQVQLELAINKVQQKTKAISNKIHTRKNFFCDVCGKNFVSRSALVRHLRVHTGEKPFKCVDCGRAFAQMEVMKRHQLVHLESRPFSCGACGAGFTQRGALAAHARAHAPPAARALSLHCCSRCPKVFLHSSGLCRHMRMHNGHVYVCNEHCKRVFKDNSSFQRHLRKVRAKANVHET